MKPRTIKPKRPPARAKARAANPNTTGFNPALGAATLSASLYEETLARVDGLPFPARLGESLGGAMGPKPPHCTRLLIVRAPGGYTLFDAEGEIEQADADPARAIAVAATPYDLLTKVQAWTDAQPSAEYPA